MNKLQEQLKSLKAKYHKLTDQAREMLGEEAPDLEAIKSLNDEIEVVKAQMVEVERTLGALGEQEAERVAEAEKAKKDRETEIDRLADEKAKAKIKSLGLDRPDYTKSEPKDDKEPEVPAHMQRILVGSVFDDMGTLDLATEYYVKSRSHKIGASQRGPSEQMYRALVTRAAEFVRETDSVPRFDRFGEVKMVDVPAFNPRDFQQEMAHRDDADTWTVSGHAVKHNDNVTPDGIKSLWELGLKANELVHSTQAGYGDELGISSVVA